MDPAQDDGAVERRPQVGDNSGPGQRDIGDLALEDRAVRQSDRRVRIGRLKAREAAELDHQRMLQELRKEVGQLVVKTTAAVAGKVLTMDDQKRLVEETNKQLAA